MQHLQKSVALDIWLGTIQRCRHPLEAFCVAAYWHGIASIFPTLFLHWSRVGLLTGPAVGTLARHLTIAAEHAR